MAKAKTSADAALKTGLDQGNAAYDQASNILDPFVSGGTAANKLYLDAIGVNGRDAQQAVQDNYLTDPFRAQNGELADQALIRSLDARGASRGGLAALAVGRANLERGSEDYNNWLTRLQGAGGQGQQAAGAQAGVATGKGDLDFGYGQQVASNAINYGNAVAQSRSTGINNLLNLAGTAVKAFTPGFSGGSAIGNMASAAKGVGNWLAGR